VNAHLARAATRCRYTLRKVQHQGLDIAFDDAGLLPSIGTKGLGIGFAITRACNAPPTHPTPHVAQPPQGTLPIPHHPTPALPSTPLPTHHPHTPCTHTTPTTHYPHCHCPTTPHQQPTTVAPPHPHPFDCRWHTPGAHTYRHCTRCATSHLPHWICRHLPARLFGTSLPAGCRLGFPLVLGHGWTVGVRWAYLLDMGMAMAWKGHSTYTATYQPPGRHPNMVRQTPRVDGSLRITRHTPRCENDDGRTTYYRRPPLLPHGHARAPTRTDNSC